MKDILEEASKIIANVEEDIEIAEMLEEREKKDNGNIYTLEEVRRLCKERNPKDEEYFFIIGKCYKDKPIGTCTKSGLIDVHKEEPGATFVKCLKEEAELYHGSSEKILPNKWKSRKIYKFNELI